MLLNALRGVLDDAWPTIADRGLSLVGVSLAGLDDADALQPELPFGVPTRRLDGAMDEIREKYGTSAITRAVLLGRDPGYSMPTLPDPPRSAEQR